ncbi:VOC family protein [Planotetraspora sp. A-T 1434]|uniref:VOC family protein n=1 Tax=Planotetraspora sp. A-T 1434 TaxID=2979219 RepID=UPI0021C0426D|nr:VOC family protein [Planotetraspora sp. A-T 1434]MCT9935311.1 VOC family protein [Planotetraspora sp. A-T 1434]
MSALDLVQLDLVQLDLVQLDLVQATIATHDLAATAALARRELGLPQGFPDPELDAWGIKNEVLTLGRTYLEIVAPASETSPLHRFLASGEGGYVVALRVPDTAGLTARAEKEGVRITHQQDFQGATITQLHPRDLGVLVEADEIPPGKEWHYDDWETPGSPGTPLDLLAVDIAVDRPEETAKLWARLFGAEETAEGVRVGDGLVRFVPVADRRGLVAADLGGAGEAREFTLAGVTLRLNSVKETT